MHFNPCGKVTSPETQFAKGPFTVAQNVTPLSPKISFGNTHVSLIQGLGVMCPSQQESRLKTSGCLTDLLQRLEVNRL